MAIYLGNKKVGMRGLVIDNSKLAQIVDRTVTEITANDLKGATKIGNYAFASCSKLISIEIPDGVTSIGNSAFKDCTNLTGVTIGNSVTSIGAEAFNSCKGLTSVEIPDSVTSIGNSAFKDCTNLTGVGIEDNSQLTSIESYAFSGCSKLTSIEFGENSQLASIGYEAFRYCRSLTSIVIPKGVTSIGSTALDIGISYAKSTVRMLPTTPPTIQSTTIGSTVEKIIVPKGCLEAYQTATNWSAKASIMEEEVV